MLNLDTHFEEKTLNMFNNYHVLLVGIGGTGSEILKNLIITGFKKITIVDLDTIELSNLNRQFLFTLEDINKSKAMCAKKNLKNLFPYYNDEFVEAYMMDINEWDMEKYSQFDVIISALDNKGARHCLNYKSLAYGIPMIDCGSLSWQGNVDFHFPKQSPCYSCFSENSPFTDSKTNNDESLSCTVHNKPKNLVECIQWSSLIVPPLIEKLDLQNEKCALNLYTHIFFELTSHLPLSVKEEIKYVEFENNDFSYIENKTYLDVLDVRENVDCFHYAVENLKKDKSSEKYSNDLICSVANIKAHMFGIDLDCRFNISVKMKNTQPTISATNSIVGAMLVMDLIKLASRKEEIRKYNLVPPGDLDNNLFLCTDVETPDPKCKCNYIHMFCKFDFDAETSSSLNAVISQKMEDLYRQNVIEIFNDDSTLVNDWDEKYVYTSSWENKRGKLPPRSLTPISKIIVENEHKQPNKRHIIIRPMRSNLLVFCEHKESVVFSVDSIKMIEKKNK